MKEFDYESRHAKRGWERSWVRYSNIGGSGEARILVDKNTGQASLQTSEAMCPHRKNSEMAVARDSARLRQR